MLEQLYPRSLRGLIELVSAKSPDAIALLGPNREACSYGQFLTQVDYVGKALRRLGIGRSDCVAIVMPDGPEMASAFWGVASYAICAPLNPFYRSDEYEYYLRDLDANAVIVPTQTESTVRDVARQLGLEVMEMNVSADEPSGVFRFESDAAESLPASEWGTDDDIALVLHTSGTTSRPKLVPLTHANLCASAHNIVDVLRLTGNDRCLNVMPLFHIHGIVGVLCASILAGGSVVCCSGYRDEEFVDLMRKCQPTWYSAVPTIHQSILALAKREPSLADAGNLRLIRSSSSSLPPTLMQELENTFGVPVIESYGMTEAAHQMASNPLPPAKRKPGSVGLPSGPDMAIMDEGGRLLAPGEIGEIVIRGTNVTAGYAHNPEANQVAFESGWFRTGDRGRTDDEGYFFITGRTKEMINRGGENISPREIDEALLQHPAVMQAVAFAVPHISLGEDVAAAVVLVPQTTLSEQELREFAFDRLADFKVPSQIIIVDTIPKGPTGKLQRIGLHEKLGALLKPEYIKPRTQMEQLLVKLWQEVLPVEQIGIHANFFGLGGDSLTAARLVSRINARFNLNVSMVSVFRAPTVVSQAKLVESILLDEIENE